MKKLLKILLYTFVFAVVVKHLLVMPYSSSIVVISGMLLTVCYFAFGGLFLNGFGLKNIRYIRRYVGGRALFAGVFAGIGVSMLVLAVLYAVLVWPGAQEMLASGTMLGVVFLLISVLLMRSLTINYITKQLKVPVGALAILLIFMWSFPERTRVSMMYKNNFDLMSAYDDWMLDKDSKMQMERFMEMKRDFDMGKK